MGITLPMRTYYAFSKYFLCVYTLGTLIISLVFFFSVKSENICDENLGLGDFKTEDIKFEGCTDFMNGESGVQQLHYP